VGQRGDESKDVSWAKVRREDTGERVCAHTKQTLEDIIAKGL
jgi:hypothetical protein